MKVLITGGAGFIGLHLAKRLILEGFYVDLLDNFSRGKLDEDLKIIIEKCNVNLIKIDLLDKDSIDKLDKDYDYIFHFAAILGVKNVIDKPLEVLSHNTLLTINILSLTQKQRKLKLFIYSSTSEIYAGTLENNLLKIPTPENSIIVLPEIKNPRTSYMLSKIYGEAICQHANIPFLIIRPHNVYGPRMGSAHVIPQLLEKAHNGQDKGCLEVYSTDHSRTFCYISDAIEQIYLLMHNEKAIGKTLNLGSQKPEITIKNLSQKIINIVGKDLLIKSMPVTQGSPSRRSPEMRLNSEISGFNSKVSLDDGINFTYQWYLKNQFKR
jgi:UDP-glucose 4-epimerase